MNKSESTSAKLPTNVAVTDHVPMAHVTDVDRSIRFYEHLGFHCHKRLVDGAGKAFYGALASGLAELMVTQASGPIKAEEQAILFYMYSPDIQSLRMQLIERGVRDGGKFDPTSPAQANTPVQSSSPVVFEPTYPFYMENGEIRLHDPDGYVILVGQLERSAHKQKLSFAGSIGQIAITVSDVTKALEFYRDIVGFKVLFTAGPNLAFLSDGAIRIMLSTPQGAGTVGANSILYVKVKEIEMTFAELAKKGVHCERAPQLTAKMPNYDLWIGFIKDPDGNLVGLMEEVPR